MADNLWGINALISFEMIKQIVSLLFINHNSTKHFNPRVKCENRYIRGGRVLLWWCTDILPNNHLTYALNYTCDVIKPNELKQANNYFQTFRFFIVLQNLNPAVMGFLIKTK